MGGSTTLAKARMELEELYLGIPDESVNLTFQDMADLKKQQSASVAATVLPSSSSSDKKQLNKKPSSTAPASLDPISEPAVNNKDGGTSSSPSPPSGSNSMKKLPSLDFNRGLQAAAAASNNHSHHHLMMHDRTRNHQHRYDSDQSPILHMDHLYRNTQEHPFHQSTEVGVHAHGHHPLHVDDAHHHHYHHHENHSNFDHATLPAYHHTDYSVNRHDHHHHKHHAHHSHSHATMEHSMATYDDTSVMSMAFDRGGGGRRRPGIPHSNICTICSTYIYIFRNRCLVCGRAYCRQCVSIGMGEMNEGRKCIDCLGRRFSQRYIQRAGQVGCCLGYPSRVKQAELEWAEKGPRRNAERGYGHSMMTSRSRSPTPMTSTRNNTTNSNPPSFVMSSPSPYSPYSPYSPVRHPIPF